jgi:hypothetical protein
MILNHLFCSHASGVISWYLQNVSSTGESLENVGLKKNSVQIEDQFSHTLLDVFIPILDCSLLSSNTRVRAKAAVLEGYFSFGRFRRDGEE